jgi:hypothetical protein
MPVRSLKNSSVDFFNRLVGFSRQLKRCSLLKKSVAELRGAEKRHRSHLHNANSRQFGREKWYFVFIKTHQFGFSTSWLV